MPSSTDRRSGRFLTAVSTFGTALRGALEAHFSADTAAGGFFRPECPAAGHCAAVAAIIAHEAPRGLGSEQARVTCVSTKVDGASHWYVAVTDGDDRVYLDLTGDQFGHAPVMVSEAPLYPETKIRSLPELNAETLSRALVLADRAGIGIAAQAFRSELAGRTVTVVPRR